MSTPSQPVAILRGGRTKRSFEIFWNPDTKKIYVKKPGLFGSSMEDTKVLASSRNMAFNAAESYVWDK